MGKAQSASLEPSTWGALQTRSPTVLRHSEYLCVVVGSRKMYCWLRSTLAFLRATPRRRGPPRATRRPSAHASTFHAHAFMYKQMASPSKPNTYHASGSKHIKQPRWFPRGCTPKSRAPRRSGQKQRRGPGSFWPGAGAWPKWSKTEALPGFILGRSRRMRLWGPVQGLACVEERAPASLHASARRLLQ